MQSVEYILRPRSFHSVPIDGERKLIGSDLLVERKGKQLGGNNIQATVRSPESTEDLRAPTADALIRLRSGWFVVPRNHFANQPEVAEAVLESAAPDLDAFVARATAAGEDHWSELSNVEIHGQGPDYWR